MGTTTHLITLALEECFTCGMPFGVTVETQAKLLKSRKVFYCPRGHAQNYIGKNEEEKLREELRREKVERRAAEEIIKAERRSKRNIKGQLTKLKKRVANGVCPCCNRTFANLHRHISRQHPDYTTT